MMISQYEITFLFKFSLLVGTISTKSVGFDVPNLVVDSQGFYDLCCPDPCEGVIHILSLVLANALAGPKSVQKSCNNRKKWGQEFSIYPVQIECILQNHLNWCNWCMLDRKEFLGRLIGAHDSTKEVMPSAV